MLYYDIKNNEVVLEEKTISFDKEVINEDGTSSTDTFRQRVAFIEKSDLEQAGIYPIVEVPLPNTFNTEFDKIVNYNYEVDDVAKVVKRVPVIESITREEIISFIKESLKDIANSFSNSTMNVIITVNGTDYTFDADRVAKDNIFTLVQNTAAEVTNTDGTTTIPTVQVRDANNNFLEMTKADLTNLYDSIVSVGNGIYAKKWELENKFNTLSTETLKNMYLFAKNNPLDVNLINTKWE